MMLLQLDWPSLRPFLGAGPGLRWQFGVVLHDNPVVANRHMRIGGLFPVGVPFGGGEIDVVGLPAQWRVAHVDLGRRLAVGRGAAVEFFGVAEGVEDLDFVAVLDVDSAVAAVLAAAEGFEGEHELDVQPEVLKFLAGFGSLLEEMAIVHLAGLAIDVEGVNARAVEEDNCAGGGLGAFVGADAFDFFQLEIVAGWRLTSKDAVGDGGFIAGAVESGVGAGYK